MAQHGWLGEDPGMPAWLDPGICRVVSSQNVPGLAVDRNGVVYVCDLRNDRLQMELFGKELILVTSQLDNIIKLLTHIVTIISISILKTSLLKRNCGIKMGD